MDTTYPPSEEQRELLKLRTETRTLLQIYGEKDTAWLSELRGAVLAAHANCQNLLVGILTKDLFETAHPRYRELGLAGQKRWPKFKEKTETWLEELPLNRLAFLAREIVGKETWLEVKELNSLRIIFAHPKDGRYKFFGKEEEQLRVYRLIKKIMQELALKDNSYQLIG